MKDRKIECTRVRACKWKGVQGDLVGVVNKKESKKFSFEVKDMVCPNCGCKTTYDID
jgi:hypothetical protein